jgi:arginyl-tRNA synthetase
MGLSTAFSAFYRDCAVVLPTEQIKSDKKQISIPKPSGTDDYFNTQDSRVLLTHATTVTLERCLDLIGIQPTKLM